MTNGILTAQHGVSENCSKGITKDRHPSIFYHGGILRERLPPAITGNDAVPAIETSCSTHGQP